MNWGYMLLKARLAGLASMILLAPANAQSPRSVLEGFGFFGNWAINCDMPATVANPRRHAFLTRGGEIHFTENYGLRAQRNFYVVFDAKRIAPDRIGLRIQLNGQAMQNLTMVKANGRLRTVANQRSDGLFLVKDGVVVGTGSETPWLSPCNEKH